MPVVEETGFSAGGVAADAEYVSDDENAGGFISDTDSSTPNGDTSFPAAKDDGRIPDDAAYLTDEDGDAAAAHHARKSRRPSQSMDTFFAAKTMQKYGRTMNHADLAAMQEEGRKRKKGLKRKEHVKRTSAGPRNTAHDLSATMHTMRSSRQSSALSSSTGM
eukprot:gene25330-16857_t